MAKAKGFSKALDMGRPPNVVKLFPNSRALIVSGKVIDRAMIKKGKAMTIAANARNTTVIRGVLTAAQRANAAVILEIAKSEATYCHISMWNLARYADTICNELGITVPVAIHADHFGLKKQPEVGKARTDIPSMFDA
ncbi:MAG TPA: class II fructose-bisphosphate aldolase, partial [Desulfomonilia bacterium]|nr:class II fructose-bisphosphate aldolase [Desulfomonilia bacterium]